jgi:hypothetical protein
VPARVGLGDEPEFFQHQARTKIAGGRERYNGSPSTAAEHCMYRFSDNLGSPVIGVNPVDHFWTTV